MGRFPPGNFFRAAFAVLLFGAAAACHRPPALTTVRRDDPNPPEHTLSVAFWNLNWFPGRYPHAKEPAQNTHISAVLPVVHGIDCDLLGLEEIADSQAAATVAGALPGFKVDVCSTFLRGPEQPRSRAKSELVADDSSASDPNIPWTVPDRQQIALCSRLPVLATGSQAWQTDPAGRRQRRGMVWAAYRIAPGEAALVYALHLKSNVLDEAGGQPTNVALREEASRQLLAHVRAAVASWSRAEHLRFILLGGDMNTSLDDHQFDQEITLRTLLDAGFHWGWSGVPLARRISLPAKGRYQATCFDHVFYQPSGGSVRVVAASLVSSTESASDHRAVTAKFAW